MAICEPVRLSACEGGSMKGGRSGSVPNVTRPVLIAHRTSPATTWMSSRRIRSRRWVSTVLMLRFSFWAIALVKLSSAIRGVDPAVRPRAGVRRDPWKI